MKIRTSASALALCLGLAVAVPAGAVSVGSQFFPGELNQKSDNSGESQNIDINANTFLDVGDTLRGTMNWQTIEDLTGGGGTHTLGAGGVNELTAIFETQVVSRTFVNNGTDGVFGTGDDIYDFEFGANAAFGTEFGTPGAAVVFFEDTTPDYSRTGTIANAETTATNGNPLPVMAWGFGLDPDENWVATGAPQSVSIFESIGAGVALGAFQFQLSILFENFAEVDFDQVPSFVTPVGGDGFIDVRASGSVLGTSGSSTEYSAFNNVDAALAPRAVPEPASLALMGLGLLGMGATARRRSKK